LLGLHYVHNNDIVHRDLKPGNIIIEKVEKLGLNIYKLTDFGVSKLIGKKFVLTVNDGMTYSYCSAEQI
jgi:serine/threonine protein kinase